METKFAPAERLAPQLLDQQIQSIRRESAMGRMLDAVPNITLVLNHQRQMVYANQAFMTYFNISSAEAMYGLRAGEILNCIHADENKTGCGTTEFCRECGATKAILNSQRNGADVQECRIVQRESLVALDFRVNTSQFKFGDQIHTIFGLTDISDEKRREALEQTFFHDVLNTAGGILGYTVMLQAVDQDEMPPIADQLLKISEQLINEIKMQRLLTQAEKGELKSEPVLINVAELMQQVVELYQAHPVAKNKHIEFNTIDSNLILKSDRTILGRVIGNMLKNALEASQPAEIVTCNCFCEKRKLIFSVENPAYIPRKVQLQVFQRSFSTKGIGRGLGTYSMRILSERYLKGKIGFTSDVTHGTRFYVELPLNYPE